jgi:hypothetical protein
MLAFFFYIWERHMGWGSLIVSLWTANYRVIEKSCNPFQTPRIIRISFHPSSHVVDYLSAFDIITSHN